MIPVMALQIIILWIVPLVIILVNPKNKATRWFSLVVFLSSFGAVTVFLEDHVHSLLFAWFGEKSAAGITVLYITGIFCSIAQYFAPYASLMFSIYYTDNLFIKSGKTQQFLKYFLLIPPMAMYFLYPIDGTRNPALNPDFRILSVWVTLYIGIGTGMVILAWLMEKEKRLRRDRKLTTLVVIPVNVFMIITHYILRALGIQDIWRYNAWVIIPGFAALLYFSARYSIWGIKLKFEKTSLERVINAATSGTALINHAIKNELCKISGCTEALKSSLPNEQTYQKQTLTMIQDSTRHILSMTERIQNHVKDIYLYITWENLTKIIHKAIDLAHPLLKEKTITVKNNINPELYLECDKIYTCELFFNLFQNATESMEQRGLLEITAEQSTQWYTVKVRDAGRGIPEDDLPYVIDPFFTTRKSENNYGLGLTFCYKVMQKLEGKFEIQSRINKGTTVFLHFPRRRLQKINPEKESPQTDSRSFRVLLVEDDPQWHKLITDYLSGEKDITVVKWVKTGDEALAAASALKPDVILMDINLPGGLYEGIYAAAEITQHKQAKVIMLTVQDDEKVIRDSFTAGAIHYLHKSHYHELPGIIRRVTTTFDPFNILLKEYTRLKSGELLSILTATEKRIFSLMEKQLTRKQIADQLFISDNTMRKHVASILKKLNARKTKEAVKKVHYRGIVKESGREKEIEDKSGE